MTDWFSTGFDEAEKMAAAGGSRRRNRNFWTRPEEIATVRFMKPAKESFNYKRCFVPFAKGQKLYTSPGAQPDPFAEAGLQLQAAFAWPIIDRRVLELEVEEEGKTVKKEIGPRLLFFADGQRTRKALIAFENMIREQMNEERAEEGLPAYTEDEYNLTHYDIQAKKDKGSPWMFNAVRGGKVKPLSDEDQELVEKYSFDLAEELKPLPTEQIRAMLRQEPAAAAAPASDAEAGYSYGDDARDEEEPSFFGG